MLRSLLKNLRKKNKFWVHSIYTTEKVSDAPASAVDGTEAGHNIADDVNIIHKTQTKIKPSSKKTSKNADSGGRSALARGKTADKATVKLKADLTTDTVFSQSSEALLTHFKVEIQKNG